MLKDYTVNYAEKTTFSVAVRAASKEDAERAADECILMFGMDHPAVSRTDYVDCEVSYIHEGLEDSQSPYVYTDPEEYD